MNLKAFPHLRWQCTNLGRRLLIAVLPNIRHAEPTKRLDVRAREELRDHDESNVVGRATCCPASGSNAFSDVMQIGGQLLMSGSRFAHGRHGPPSVWASSSRTTPAKRPVRC